jgi:hypothetical protein
VGVLVGVGVGVGDGLGVPDELASGEGVLVGVGVGAAEGAALACAVALGVALAVADGLGDEAPGCWMAIAASKVAVTGGPFRTDAFTVAAGRLAHVVAALRTSVRTA